MSKFNQHLTELLKKDSRFIDENNELIRTEIINETLKMDKDLISALLSDEETKEKFFTEIQGHWIFEMNKFIDYIQDKNFLNDSYTKYKNKIGLSIGNKLLKEKREVVLSFPFKDCILEGGQTKEEEKRKEIFFNEVLAQDEIDRLLEPKVLTNFKRYTSKGEEKVKNFNRSDKGVIKENLIIKGNNLLALYSIKKQFQGKIKIIYIDPPFNTGNDSFGYNDNFNHSTWLTFMKNRLEVAKELLAKDGAIFIHLDDTETAYCKIMLDEIFGRDNHCNTITISTNKPFGFKGTSKDIFKQATYLLFYAKDKKNINLNPEYIETGYDNGYNLVFEDIALPESKWKWRSVKDLVSEELGFKSKKEAIVKLGEEAFNKKISLFALNNSERVFRKATVTGGAYKKRETTIKKSKEQKDKIIRHPDDDMDYLFIGGQRVIFYKNKLKEVNGKKVPAEELTNIWNDLPIEALSYEGGIDFPKGKKPEKLIQRIINLISDKKEDIVLDYHLGSGTTGAVAHKMGRQYIGIEQLNYEENGSITRLKNVMGVEKSKGKLKPAIDSFDKSGISNLVNWKGGGDFVYCELARYNDNFIEKIYKAKNTRELLKIWEEMKRKSFINYNVDVKTAYKFS